MFTGRAAVFASRVAKPECRTTIFTGRPAVFASRVAKPECQTTMFTGRPAVFASRVAKPECRTTIFTGRPDRLLFYFFYYFTISYPFVSRQRFFAWRAANPTRPPHPSIFQSFVASRTAFFACRLMFLHVAQTGSRQERAEGFAFSVRSPGLSLGIEGVESKAWGFAGTNSSASATCNHIHEASEGALS